MTRKRKRRRSGSRSRGASRARPQQHRAAKAPRATPDSGATADRRSPEPSTEAATETTARGARRRGRPSVWPPLGGSLFQGFRVVGSDPAVLAAAFLGMLATWGILVVLGTSPTLRGMVVLMSPSPVHVFFDVDAIVQTGGTSTAALISTLALGAVRAATLGAFMLLVADSLRGEPHELRGLLRRLAKAGPSLYLIYLLEVAVVVLALQAVVAFVPAFGLLVPLVALHFLVFIPIVIALEVVPAREGLRLGFRAARLPGGGHLILVLAYFMVVLYLARLTSPLAPVTPTVLGWALALTATFVHAGVLGAFTYRWLVVGAHDSVRQPGGGARTPR